MMKAIRLQLIDKERNLHAQAWLNVQATATKQRGKKTVPYFSSFNEFFKSPDEETANTPERRQNEQEQKQLKALILRANLSSGG
jgi:hypothetical protein